MTPSTPEQTGLRVLLLLRIVAPSVFCLLPVLAVLAAFGLVDTVPPLLFEVTVLVAPVALAVYWRPAFRVPDGLWLTGLSALFLGMGGAGWGSVFAPVVGAATLLAMLVRPRAPTQRRSGQTVTGTARMPKIRTPSGRRRITLR